MKVNINGQFVDIPDDVFNQMFVGRSPQYNFVDFNELNKNNRMYESDSVIVAKPFKIFKVTSVDVIDAEFEVIDDGSA